MSKTCQGCVVQWSCHIWHRCFIPWRVRVKKATPDYIRLPLLKKELQDTFLDVLLSLGRPCMVHPIPGGVLRQRKCCLDFPNGKLLIQLREIYQADSCNRPFCTDFGET